MKDLFEEKVKTISELEIRRIDKILTIDGFRDFMKKMQIYLRLIGKPSVIYALAYIGIAILGLFCHNFFYALLLIEFIKSIPILADVLKSVTESAVELGFLFSFFLILVYFYALIIFYFFYDIMPSDSCSSVPMCFSAIYSNTFTSGGNLGNFIDESNDGENFNAEGDILRYLLDISYSLIVLWIVFQLVSGIIVDKFSSLRSDRKTIEDDIKDFCFICGLERKKIEKYYIGKDGFNKHLEDHNIESYFFYMLYLQEKDPNEYSGIETYIKEQIDKESILWFPVGRCLMKEDWEKKH